MRSRTPKTYSTTRQAMEQVVATIRAHLPLIPGAKDGGYLERTLSDALERDYLTIEWERSWGVGCSLSISIGHGRLEQEEMRVVHHRKVRVEIGWSSTGRGTAEAIAAIALYQQVAQLACLIESVLARMEIAEVTEKPAAK